MSDTRSGFSTRDLTRNLSLASSKRRGARSTRGTNAFKAGVKPSAIARQFGISQFDVRKALARHAQHLACRRSMNPRHPRQPPGVAAAFFSFAGLAGRRPRRSASVVTTDGYPRLISSSFFASVSPYAKLVVGFLEASRGKIDPWHQTLKNRWGIITCQAIGKPRSGLRGRLQPPLCRRDGKRITSPSGARNGFRAEMTGRRSAWHIRGPQPTYAGGCERQTWK
jgi:hypothetical protein